MELTKQITRHLRDLHFGGNWTWVNLKDTLADAIWQQATTQVCSFNSIAMLVYQMNYYLNAVLGVLESKQLTSRHEDSFKHPAISSQKDWNELMDKTWNDAEHFASVIEKLPEQKLWETFCEE